MSEQLPLLVGLTTLKAEGATHVGLFYSGSGDEGGISSVVVYAHTEETPLTGIDEDNTSAIALDGDLQELVEHWAHEHVIPGGYENDDGGRGSVLINLTTWEVTHECITYVMEEQLETIITSMDHE